jgi:glycerate 2-kinase
VNASPPPAAPPLAEIYGAVTVAVDGARLCAAACAEPEVESFVARGPLAVLALGKAAGSMLAGLVRARPELAGTGMLVIAPPGVAGIDALPPAARLLVSDHPQPGARSLTAGREARDFVAGLAPPHRLLVLLSGGGSALAVLPADGVALDDKRQATLALARAGANIFELNTLRKHLSAIKGGRLGATAGVPVQVLALSDVLGDDPATIASGPFTADPTTFADALRITTDLGAALPTAIDRHLRDGARGQAPETPKPGDRRLADVSYKVIAGPERVAAEARRAIEGRGLKAGLLSRNVGGPVAELAAAYIDRARAEASTAGPTRVLVGNGEPTIVLAAAGGAPGVGGRSTHLALLVGRGIAGLPGVAFLAAGTDDRDGSAEGAGAVVDGSTWARAVAAGLDPAAALTACDSARPLAALGCLVRSPGTSNLLDVHLLGVSGRTPD